MFLLSVATMRSAGSATFGLPFMQPVFSLSIIHPPIFADIWSRQRAQKVCDVLSPDNAIARKFKVLNTNDLRYRSGGSLGPALSLRGPLSSSCGPTTLPDP